MQWGKVIGCYQTASRAEDFAVLAAIMAPHAITLAGDNSSSILHVQRILLGSLDRKEHVSANNDVRKAIRTHIELRGAGATLALKDKAHATEEQLRDGRITCAQLYAGNAKVDAVAKRALLEHDQQLAGLGPVLAQRGWLYVRFLTELASLFVRIARAVGPRTWMPFRALGRCTQLFLGASAWCGR